MKKIILVILIVFLFITGCVQPPMEKNKRNFGVFISCNGIYNEISSIMECKQNRYV